MALIELSQIMAVAREPWVGLLAGSIGGGLAMLGPGRWSVDAQLFGWKRIEAPPAPKPFERARSFRVVARP